MHSANGAVIANFDYKDSLHALIDTTLNAGTYFVSIDGSSNINSTNDYGSLGSYTLDGYYSGTTTTSTTKTRTTTGVKRSSNSSSFTGSDLENSNQSNFDVIKQIHSPLIVNAKTPYEYRITDINGRSLLVGKSERGTRTFDMQRQPAGLYIIQLISAGERVAEQFFNN